MRDFWRIVAAVAVISISVFLIQRSCHDGNGPHDPDKSGGIGGVALERRVPEAVTTTPQTGTTQGSTAGAEAVTARAETSKSDKESEGVTARVETRRSDEERVRRYQRALEELQGDTANSARNASAGVANVVNPTQQIQGTWILLDPNNTIVELTVQNDSGSLRMYSSQSARNDSVASNVRVSSEGRAIWVVTSHADESASRIVGREPIRLAFLFDASASPRVLRLSSTDKEPAHLRVVSHTK